MERRANSSLKDRACNLPAIKTCPWKFVSTFGKRGFVVNGAPRLVFGAFSCWSGLALRFKSWFELATGSAGAHGCDPACLTTPRIRFSEAGRERAGKRLGRQDRERQLVAAKRQLPQNTLSLKLHLQTWTPVLLVHRVHPMLTGTPSARLTNAALQAASWLPGGLSIRRQSKMAPEAS